MRLLSHSSRPTNGFTLIEVAVSATLFTIVGIGSMAFFRTTMKSMHDSAEVAKESNRQGAGLQLLHRDLERTDPEHLRIDTTDPRADMLELQVVVGFDASGPIWGAIVPGCKTDGGRRAGWTVRYEVSGTALRRVYLDDAGQATSYAEVLIPRLPETGSEKVFSISRPDPTNAPMLLRFDVLAESKSGELLHSADLSGNIRIGGTGSETLRVEELGRKLLTRL
jgi:type II secretory pathway component PulJ